MGAIVSSKSNVFIGLATLNPNGKGYRSKSFPPNRLSHFRKSWFFSYYDTVSKGRGRNGQLLMNKVCIYPCATFHEIVDPYISILGGEAFAEDLGFEFQPLCKGHFRAL